MDVLLVKMVSEELVSVCLASGDYGDVPSILTNQIATSYPDKTVAAAVIAQIEDVTAFSVTNAVAYNDFHIAEKQNVPGGDTIFLPNGVEIGNVAADTLVLHATPAA